MTKILKRCLSKWFENMHERKFFVIVKLKHITLPQYKFLFLMPLIKKDDMAIESLNQEGL